MQIISKPTALTNDATFFKSEAAKIYGWAYTTRRDTVAVLIYTGKSTKPYVHLSYKSAERRAQHVTDIINSRVEEFKASAKHKAERVKPSELKEGDVLCTSWGYDQTNVEFYIVKKCIGKRTVLICEIGIDEHKADSSMSGRVYPDVLKEIGKPFKKVVSFGNTIKAHQCATAHLWDGKYKYTSSYH